MPPLHARPMDDPWRMSFSMDVPGHADSRLGFLFADEATGGGKEVSEGCHPQTRP